VSGIEPDPLAPSPADPRILSTAAARRTAASCCTPNTAAKSAGRPAQCALIPPCRRSTAAAPVSGGCCCCRPVPVAGGEWLLRCFYYGCVAGSGPSVGMYRIRRCRPTAVVRLIHTPFVWFEDLRRSGRHSPTAITSLGSPSLVAATAPRRQFRQIRGFLCRAHPSGRRAGAAAVPGCCGAAETLRADAADHIYASVGVVDGRRNRMDSVWFGCPPPPIPGFMQYHSLRSLLFFVVVANGSLSVKY